MAFFEWDESFSVGVAELNRQHQRLIDLINELYEATQQGQDRNRLTSAVDELETMAAVLDQLIDYSNYHFAMEERYMVEFAYPEYEEHKRAHGEFVNRSEAFRRDFDEGTALLSMEIMQFLQNWWKDHIVDVDKKYGPLLNERGVR